MAARPVTTSDWESWLARWNAELFERIDPTLENRMSQAGLTVEHSLLRHEYRQSILHERGAGQLGRDDDLQLITLKYKRETVRWKSSFTNLERLRPSIGTPSNTDGPLVLAETQRRRRTRSWSRPC
jgi:hypothetical protein